MTEREMRPAEIEKKSFAIISRELGSRVFPAEQEMVIKRVIHTTADFEYADTLTFTHDAVARGKEAIREGAVIVTDTQMVRAGINKRVLAAFGGEVLCFMSDDDVAEAAAKEGTTRAAASMKKAAALSVPVIFAIGNAPTALLTLAELIREGALAPKLIIGVPVGFVNVTEAKESILSLPVPAIVARGRKGGSNVAAAIVNALLYELDPGRGKGSGK